MAICLSVPCTLTCFAHQHTTLSQAETGANRAGLQSNATNVRVSHCTASGGWISSSCVKIF